jgi:hypothetical protein
MVDSDIVIPPDTLVKMLDAPVNICFGVYPRKNKPGETELFKDDTFDFTNRYTYEELSKEDVNKIPVKGSGFGCALIKTDAHRPHAIALVQQSPRLDADILLGRAINLKAHVFETRLSPLARLDIQQIVEPAQRVDNRSKLVVAILATT